MKKVLSVLAVLALAGVSAFAADKQFQLKTDIADVNGFKVFAPTDSASVTYANVFSDSKADDLGEVEVGTGWTDLKIVAVATNKKSRTVKVSASGTRLAADGATTYMGYSVKAGDTELTAVKSTDEGSVSLGDVVSVTGDGGQNIEQVLLKAAVNNDDFTAAAAGSYKATITLTLSSNS